MAQWPNGSALCNGAVRNRSSLRAPPTLRGALQPCRARRSRRPSSASPRRANPGVAASAMNSKQLIVFRPTPRRENASRPFSTALGSDHRKAEEENMEFVGMTALVTGGASGIGKATVMQLVREGASVICADIDQTKGKALVEEGKTSGSAIDYEPIDLTDG